VQRCEERLGEGEGVRSEGVAGFEQSGDTGVVLKDCAQPVREHLDPFGPSEAVIDRAVDLGQYSVEDEVVELFLVAHVAVQRRGNDSETGGKGAHAQRVHAVGTNDRESLGDDVFAGKRAATALFTGGRDEPQRAGASIVNLCLSSLRHVRLRKRLTVNGVHCSVNSVARKRMSFT